MDTLISIPLTRLSPDKLRRHAQLRDYFCDKDAIATQVGDEWQLELEWSNDPYRYVDPRLNEGLLWWGNELQFKDMATARKRKGRVLLSLNDTWTLESWSEWFNRDAGKNNVVVLHVDDHKDLGSPRIFLSPNGWVDPITGRVFDFDNPNSVSKAIESGALGMGSFLTPFLHLIPHSDVRHLCQSPKCTDTSDFAIRLDTTPDLLLNLDARRPSVILEETTALSSKSNGVVHGRYRFTNNLDAWLEGLELQVEKNNTAFLLHIDMDYFCNRYDGDSDALLHPCPLDLSLPQVLEQIDILTGALRSRSLITSLDDIVIALSPGFFPSEFWAASCERLLKGLGEL